MVPYEAIRLAVVRGLQAFTGSLVIEMNGGGNIPEGEFMTYDFPEGFGGATGQPVIEHAADKTTYRETIPFTMTFMAYTDNRDIAMVNALRAADWFRTIGAAALKSLDVVVVSVGEVQNRDINIGEEWERRSGFDVEFRTTNVVEDTSDVNFIETANIRGS